MVTWKKYLFSILSFFSRCLAARDKMPISRSRVPPVNPLQLENIYTLIKLSEEIEEQRYESACQDIQVSLLWYIGQPRSACQDIQVNLLGYIDQLVLSGYIGQLVRIYRSACQDIQVSLSGYIDQLVLSGYISQLVRIYRSACQDMQVSLSGYIV